MHVNEDNCTENCHLGSNEFYNDVSAPLTCRCKMKFPIIKLTIYFAKCQFWRQISPERTWKCNLVFIHLFRFSLIAELYKNAHLGNWFKMFMTLLQCPWPLQTTTYWSILLKEDITMVIQPINHLEKRILLHKNDLTGTSFAFWLGNTYQCVPVKIVKIQSIVLLQWMHTEWHSVDPDQTAPLGAVWSGSTLFA